MKWCLKVLTPIQLLIPPSAQAAYLLSAKVDRKGENLIAQVVYRGGCKPHLFRIEVDSCSERAPMTCIATLVDVTKDDNCIEIVERKIEVSLEESGLKDPYFAGSRLMMTGEDYQGSSEKQIRVRLP